MPTVAALLVSLRLAYTLPSLSEAMHYNIAAGGDNCSRAMVLGAIYGAASASCVPAEWEAQLDRKRWQEVCAAAEKVAADGQAAAVAAVAAASE